MDTARCHLTQPVKTELQKTNTVVQYVPGGMTPLLQPLDTHVNKPLKASMRKKWEKWMEAGEVEFTRSGKRKRASYEQVAKWVSEAVAELDPDMIKQAFSECGIRGSGSEGDYHSRLQKYMDGGVVSEHESDFSEDEDVSYDEEFLRMFHDSGDDEVFDGFA